MSYEIKSIDFFVRETRPARIASALGKKGQSAKAAKRVTSPICHARVVLKSENREVFGCAADRLSVRWLDKRPDRTQLQKRRKLAELIEFAANAYRKLGAFQNPFDAWARVHPLVMKEGRRRREELLTASFASALLERALIDATCRLHKVPFYLMVTDPRLGLKMDKIHPELKGVKAEQFLPDRPQTRIHCRHTVGLFDPLSDKDWPKSNRINDGLPETLVDVIRRYGIRHFKLKISGNADKDLKRLETIWDLIPISSEPIVTLDANEAYTDLAAFGAFVKKLEQTNLGLFQHVAFIEQPLRRDVALDPKERKRIKAISERKPLIIDESDDHLRALSKALSVGYSGTSHKNCKGVYKSIANLGLLYKRSLQGYDAVLSGEDLQNLPVVPLQQDLVAVGTLGIEHCERNGHHYNFGLSMLPDEEKAIAVKRHPDLYEKRGDECFLRIKDGAMETTSLHQEGFGVSFEPKWETMVPLSKFVKV